MTLKDYIQGKRTGKEANRLERDAMKDPFLQDAIDGFDSVQGNHTDVIRKLEKKIGKKKNKQSIVRIVVLSAAATLALIVGISVLFKPLDEKKLIAKTLTPDSATQDTVKNIKPVIAMNDGSVKTKTHKKHKLIPAAEKENETNMTTAVATTDNIIEEDHNIAAERSSVSVPATDKNVGASESLVTFNEPNIIPGITTAGGRQTIRGVVTDENGLPIIGASVKLKENQYIATTTDLEGRFLLSGRNLIGNEIEASYLGYNNAVVQAKTDSTVIKLRENNLALNEVVVVGYGATGKKSISHTSKNKHSLNGKLAGVNVTHSEFGEKEFREFIDFSLSDSVCSGDKISLTAKFKINENGKPEDIKIVYSSCETLEKEFLNLIRLSPTWTDRNKTIVLKYRK
jgi:hypothetical protein